MSNAILSYDGRGKLNLKRHSFATDIVVKPVEKEIPAVDPAHKPSFYDGSGVLFTGKA